MTRIPVIQVTNLPERGDAQTALVLTSTRPVPPGFALVRHADGAAVAQAGACGCCRTPSGLTTVLRQLFLDRVRGAATFETVIVATDSDLPIAEAMQDPLVAARYRQAIEP